MRVFVTGADGFLGSNLLRELKKRNHEVIAFLQKNRNHEHIEHLVDEKKFGDLLDPESLLESVVNCDAVIHTAANTDIWPPRKEIVRRVNIEGSRNVIEAVKANRIPRLVYVGTANSFGPGSMENPGDETRPYAAAKYGLDYMDSKYEVQQFIEQEAKSGELPAVIVNPTFMMGPYDSKPGPGEMLIGIYHEKAPGYSPGGRNVIHVQDACVAIANALEMGRIGDSYILAGENLSYKDLFALMADVVGSKAPNKAVPRWATVFFGSLLSVLAKIFGFRPKVSREMALISCDTNYFSSAKAQKELKLPQTPVRKALEDHHQWFVEHGYYDKK
jgi:dihydroflavonol-4-reductase